MHHQCSKTAMAPLLPKHGTCKSNSMPERQGSSEVRLVDLNRCVGSLLITSPNPVVGVQRLRSCSRHGPVLLDQLADDGQDLLGRLADVMLQQCFGLVGLSVSTQLD